MVQSLKFNYFGHDTVILHEREIRIKSPPFTFKSREREREFMLDLSKIIETSKFVLVSSAILKNEITIKPLRNAYYIALSSCLENLFVFLTEKNQQHLKTFIVVESRGDREDKELELEFRRICDGDNAFRITLPFEVIIKSKQVNSTGMQFADLFARPIGRHLLDSEDKKNQAFDILKMKFFCENNKCLGENYRGFGLTLFPNSDSKKAKGPEIRSRDADRGTPQST